MRLELEGPLLLLEACTGTSCVELEKYALACSNPEEQAVARVAAAPVALNLLTSMADAYRCARSAGVLGVLLLCSLYTHNFQSMHKNLQPADCKLSVLTLPHDQSGGLSKGGSELPHSNVLLAPSNNRIARYPAVFREKGNRNSRTLPCSTL
jgi:hypothetical protein